MYGVVTLLVGEVLWSGGGAKLKDDNVDATVEGEGGRGIFAAKRNGGFNCSV